VGEDAVQRLPGPQPVPAGADEDHVQAGYDMGVLEVAIEIKDQAHEKAGKRIPVTLNRHIKPT
jgi:HSP20 family molecular chaperone IbpA